MTNFLKMAQAILNLGYDVYIFKRFADGGRGDFIPQLSRIRTIFFVDRQTGRIYTCTYDCFYSGKAVFGFGAVAYKAAIKQAHYGYEGYVYWCQADGTLDTSGLKSFLDDVLSDMEEVYGEDGVTDSSLFKTEDFTERYIAKIAFQIGFKLRYKI